MAFRYYQAPAGSSLGWGNWPGSADGTPNPAEYPTTGQLPNDSAVYDLSQGMWVNQRTKKAWTGDLANGMYAHQGKLAQRQMPMGVNAAAAIDPNDVKSRYQAVDIVKSPTVAAGAEDLMGEFKKGAHATLDGFDDYVKQFKTAAGGAIAGQRQANDVSGVTAALGGAQSRYAASLGQAGEDYTALNADNAARQRAIVDHAHGLLSDYDTAMNNARDLAQRQVTGAVSRYAAGKNGAAGGVNMGLGTDVANILAQKSYEASLPYEQAKINRRYDVLQNYDLPVQRDIAGRETARIAQFNPAVAAQVYGSDQDTQMKIQSLKSAAASSNWQVALQLLQVPGMAAQIRNQILAGDTSLLAAISQIEESSHYRGLQDKLGVNLAKPQFFSAGDLTYPSLPPSSRYSNYGGRGPATGNSLPASNAPLTINPNAVPQGANMADYAYFKQTGFWPQQDPNFSQEAYDNILAGYRDIRDRQGYRQYDMPAGPENAVSQYDVDPGPVNVSRYAGGVYGVDPGPVNVVPQYGVDPGPVNVSRYGSVLGPDNVMSQYSTPAGPYMSPYEWAVMEGNRVLRGIWK